MKAALALLALLALAALAMTVSAQNIVVPAPPPVLDPLTGLPVVTEEEAVIGRPRAGLRKPIIFDPKPLWPQTTDPDEPIFGRPPVNLKPAAVSEVVGASAVEFEKGRELSGCPCRRQLPDKWRYDVKLRRQFPQFNFTACGCPIFPPRPEDALPPVVARLRREPQLFAMPLPSNGTHTLLLNGTLAAGRFSLLSNGTVFQSAAAPLSADGVQPIYRKMPRDLAERIRARLNATQPLFNLTKLLFPWTQQQQTVQPKFYPSWAERRERRRARREAARQAALAAATKKF